VPDDDSDADGVANCNDDCPDTPPGTPVDPNGCPSNDCNGNQVDDAQDILNGFSQDCNANTIPDECDLASGTSTDLNGTGVPDECEALGALNCDGLVDFRDINPFVMALTNPAAYEAAYPGCPLENRDINGDGNFGFGDINPFIALLAAG